MTSYTCKFCGAPGARFRRFKRVRGYMVFSTISETPPVAICDQHKFRASLRTSGWNVLFGWWAIHAFFWNIFALVRNSLGGRDVTSEVEQLATSEILQAAKAVLEAKK